MSCGKISNGKYGKNRKFSPNNVYPALKLSILKIVPITSSTEVHHRCTEFLLDLLFINVTINSEASVKQCVIIQIREFSLSSCTI